jgi:hypothetical protein
VFGEEVPREDEDVFPPVAKWRQIDGERAETVVEVRAEGPTFHELARGCVGRGKEADIYLPLSTAAKRTEAFLLEHAQQCNLPSGRQRIHFIQEKRAMMRFSEQPGSPRSRICERATLVSEQFVFKQGVRQSATIHRDEWKGGTPPQVMNRARDQLLAGAGLARDQYGFVRFRDDSDVPDRRQKGRCVADELTQTIGLAYLLD